MNNPRELLSDPQYVYGQVLALRALLVGVVKLSGINADDFRAMSIEQLELLRTAVTPSTASDTMLTAVDDTEDWVRRTTGQG